MTDPVLYLETPCPHGEIAAHDDNVGNGIDRLPCSAHTFPVDCEYPGHCPGGVRRRVTPDYEKAAEVLKGLGLGCSSDEWPCEGCVEEAAWIVDSALDFGEEE